MKALSAYSLLLFILISSHTFAQTEKGRLRIGGSFSASHTRGESEQLNGSSSYTIDSKETDISLSPLGGIFLVDGLEVGLSPSVNWMSRSNEGSPFTGVLTDQENFFFSFGPYLNYYIGKGEKGKPFVGLKPEIGRGNGSQVYTDPFNGVSEITLENDTKVKSLDVTAGYALFLNDAYILSFYAGYTYSHYTFEQENGYETNSKTGIFKLGVAVSTTFKRQN